MDAQQMHDEQMVRRKPIDSDSRSRLEALLAKKGNSAREVGLVDWVVKNHPGLTREKGQEMIDYFGW